MRGSGAMDGSMGAELILPVENRHAEREAVFYRVRLKGLSLVPWTTNTNVAPQCVFTACAAACGQFLKP